MRCVIRLNQRKNIIWYGKCPKIFKHFIPHFLGLNLVFMQQFLKIISEMANNADPDQTASDLGLCLHMPFCQKLWCKTF